MKTTHLGLYRAIRPVAPQQAMNLTGRVDARPAPVARPVTWPLTLPDRRRGGAR